MLEVRNISNRGAGGYLLEATVMGSPVVGPGPGPATCSPVCSAPPEPSHHTPEQLLGPIPDDSRCRITHCANDFEFENIVGKTIASVRKSLATIFSIPDDAEAYVGGVVVGPAYKLRPGDWVNFSR